jgi:hypothetical protein
LKASSRPQNKAGAGGKLCLRFVSVMEKLTMDRIGQIAVANAYRNKKFLKKGLSLQALRGESFGKEDHAVVIAAGPSLKRQKSVERIKKKGYSGIIISTDSAVRYCLSTGMVPDLIVTLDPHAKRIVRWFGDTRLKKSELHKDDYFRRQDLDVAFADEIRSNQETLKLFERYGKRMSIALSTSAPKDVVERVLEIGMRIYWWNPIFDNPDRPGSLTRRIYQMNRLPAVNAGGNCGSACWMMAHAVLNKRKVGLVGLDFSYYPETPYKNSQYYYEAVKLVGADRLDDFFIRIYNPYVKKWFYTDPAYMWYRNAFLDMAKDADCSTYNCTGGGIVFGDAIEFTALDRFLDKMDKKSGRQTITRHG